MERHCKNCDQILEDKAKYCPNCGQKYFEKTTLTSLFNKVLKSFLSIDSKLIKTILPFFFLPGRIAKEYVNGKQSTYLDPIQFLFFASFLFFFMLNVVVDVDQIEQKVGTALHQKRKGVVAPSDTIHIADSIQFNLAAITMSLNKLDSLIEVGKSDEEIYEELGLESSNVLVNFVIRIYRRNSTGLIKAFLNQTSLTTLLVLPVFCGFLYLLYFRKKIGYAEQLVHVFYLFSFVLIFATTLLFAGQYLASSNLVLLYFTVVPIYSLISFKVFYEDRWIISFFKLGISFFFILLVVIPTLLVGSALLTVLDY